MKSEFCLRCGKKNDNKDGSYCRKCKEKNKMKQKIFLLMFAVILLTSLASAEIQYFQVKQDLGNGTIQNLITVWYDKIGFYSKDYITGNNPLDVYILFNIYPKTWNSQNPTAKVDYCNWRISFWTTGNGTINIINENFTETDTDVMGDKYFVRMNDGEGITAYQKCYFQNHSYTDLYLPMEMQLLTPSWECKECQYYLWTLTERDIIKAKSIGDNVVEVSTYIKKLFLLNFEIWLAFFWFFLIMMVFASISLIFIIIYWLFLFLRRFM